MMIGALPVLAQEDFLIKANQAVDGQQKRIDFIDGLKDGNVQLLSEIQTKMATDLYIYKVNRVQKNINNEDYPMTGSGFNVGFVKQSENQDQIVLVLLTDMVLNLW